MRKKSRIILILVTVICIIGEITCIHLKGSNVIATDTIAMIDSEEKLNIENVEEYYSYKDADGKLKYKENVGGIYKNSFGKYVVQFVKNSSAKSDVQLFDDLQVEYVDNSYNELEIVNEKIIDYFLDNSEPCVKLIANYIDVYSNKVIVELENNSINEQRNFKSKVVDSNLIEFIDGSRIISSLNPGGDLGQPPCSMGYRAKLNGKSGYITAGHCVPESSVNGTPYYTGTVRKRQFSGNIDAAFIEAKSNVSLTNTLEYAIGVTKSLSTTTDSIISVGQKIEKVGRITKSKTGTIKSTNWSGVIDGVYLIGLFRATIETERGDSGGPVFLDRMSSSANLLGITTGVAENDKYYSVFTYAHNINRVFGISRY